MEIIFADGVHIGAVEGDRIRMTRADSGSHRDHHHYISDAAVLLEEEKGGEALADKRE